MTEFELQTRSSVLEALQNLSLPFDLMEHEPVHTIEDCRIIDRHWSVPMAKNLFLRNRAGTQLYLLTMRGEKTFHTSDVSRQVGSTRLSFADADLLRRHLHTLPGAISPLGLLFDADCSVQFLLDEDLLCEPFIVVHPCVNTASLRIPTEELIRRFLTHVNHTLTTIHMD